MVGGGVLGEGATPHGLEWKGQGQMRCEGWEPSPTQPSCAIQRSATQRRAIITSGPPHSGAAPGAAPGRDAKCPQASPALQTSWRCSGSLPYGAIFCSVQP